MGGAPAFAAVAAVCDVDGDGDVDRLDVNLVLAARNQPASAGDPRDADGNGTINVLDGRKCTSLCTLPNCAIKNPNTPPKADAGPDQTGRVGDRITLNGAASSDADGNALRFTWALLPPAGSAAALSDPNAVSPQFTIDQKGDYIAQLIVNDGQVDSAPDEVKIATSNSAPVANAGPDQSLTVRAEVTLNGAGSSDVDGDPLTFAWSFTGMPAGSSAFLSDPTSVNPSFVADRPGTYEVQLVVNDGTEDSAPAKVTISSGNTPPVAHAGLGQTVPAGASVTLDGSGSTDAEGQALTYQWALTSIPPGSAAALSNSTDVNPGFEADLPGLYVAQLIVNDGYVDSLPATVQISTTNSAPVANAGPNQTVVAGADVQLDGSGSTDVDGNRISYRWSFITRPADSNAALSNEHEVKPTFTADVLGDYVLQLIVNDGFVDSVPATVQISTTNSAPVANPGSAQTVPLGSLVQLDGSASSDADNHPLTYKWSLSPPTDSTAALSSLTAVNPSFVADRPGNYVVQLIVNDGFVNSPAATVQISTTNSAPVANAGPDPDQPVPSGTTSVTLDGSGSSDPDGDPLTYEWSITKEPDGSTAALSDPTAQKPTLGSAGHPLSAGTYVLQLIVNDGQVDSPPDTMTVEVAGGTPPAAPSNLTAAALNDSAVGLFWWDNSGNESGFKVEAKVEFNGVAGDWQETLTIPADIFKTGIGPLTASYTYYFRVRAYNASGNSAYSNEIDVRAPGSCRILFDLASGAQVEPFDDTLVTYCVSSQPGRYAKFYTFTLESARNVRIAMSGLGDNDVVYLRSGNAVSGSYIAAGDVLGNPYIVFPRVIRTCE